jgi:hypothetical protein
MKQATGTRAKLKNYKARLKSAEHDLVICRRWRADAWAEEARLKIEELTRLIREAEKEPVPA